MYLTTTSRPPSRWDLYSGRGEGGGPSLPLEHSLVLHKTVSANFKVSQLEHSCARERQVTYMARFKFHSFLLIDTIVMLIIPVAVPLAPCPYFITAVADVPFAFTPLITPVW